MEFDHVQAVARGGSNDLDNIVLACVWCNRMKRDGVKGPLPVPAEWPEGVLPRPVPKPRTRVARDQPRVVQPRKSREPMIVKALRLEASEVDAVQLVADREGIGWSEAFRLMMEFASPEMPRGWTPCQELV